jgi:integrase
MSRRAVCRAEPYVAAHGAGWHNGGRHRLASLSTYVFRVFGDIAVAADDLRLVMQAVEPKPLTAHNAHKGVEMVLDWAKVRGLYHARTRCGGKAISKRGCRTARRWLRSCTAGRCPTARGGGFMVELKKLTDTSARVLEFEILTAAPWGEVVGARWDEIDVRASLWFIPGDRMKRGCEPRAPSSSAAIAVPERQATVRGATTSFPAGCEGSRSVSTPR